MITGDDITNPLSELAKDKCIKSMGTRCFSGNYEMNGCVATNLMPLYHMVTLRTFCSSDLYPDYFFLVRVCECQYVQYMDVLLSKWADRTNK